LTVNIGHKVTPVTTRRKDTLGHADEARWPKITSRYKHIN